MPIPHKTVLEALYTQHTCGDACWRAKDDICHCSCGGKNHGCLRSEDGEQPARTKRIKGMMYQLAAVSPAPENCSCAVDAYEPIDNLHHTINDNAINSGLCTFGDIHYAEGYRMNNLPCYTKTPSDGEIQRWPEFAAWRDQTVKWFKPVALWVRVDMIHLVPEGI